MNTLNNNLIQVDGNGNIIIQDIDNSTITVNINDNDKLNNLILSYNKRLLEITEGTMMQELKHISNSLKSIYARNDTSLLNSIWNKLDIDLRDALDLAYNKILREGRNTLQTRDLFSALARFGDDKINKIFNELPTNCIPKTIDQSIKIEQFILSKQPPLSGCINDSLTHFNSKNLSRQITMTDVFIDIAEYGSGSSVHQLRINGIGRDEIVNILKKHNINVLNRY